MADTPDAFQPSDDGQHTDIFVDPQTGTVQHFVDGALVEPQADGGLSIELNPRPERREPGDFDENLAELLSDEDLSRICGRLMQSIEADDESRREWLETRAKNIDLLGFRADPMRSDGSNSSAPVEGMSTIINPLLVEAVLRFQSNASSELYPAGGPVKVQVMGAPQPALADTTPVMFGHNGGPPLSDAFGDPEDDAFQDLENQPESPLQAAIQQVDRDALAQALEADMNYYLTNVDKGYRPDSVRNLFWIGFGGCGFKKVYNCPIKRMPISRSVDAQNLIVSNAANDITDAGMRITEVISLPHSTYVRMQIAGIYRKTGPLGQAVWDPDPVREKIAEVQGISELAQMPDDRDYTIYECYCELDIPGYEHLDEDGNPTGLELPYRVSIDKHRREILEIRRNWREDDDTFTAKQTYVKFSFMPAMGFYDIGLSHILGQSTRALTMVWRMLLDAGMFASFPGFLYSDAGGRQVTNEFRVPPGGGVKIQTGGMPINQVVMPLPYGGPSGSLVQIGSEIQQIAERVGGTAEISVGEGKADAPVGTTLALIEQATKMLSAVHINLHAAQSEELQLLKERFREDPKAFWRLNRRPARKWEVEEFLAALDECDLVPAADPNTSSQLQRVMKAVAVKQLQAATPWLYDPEKVDSKILMQIGIDPASVIIPGAQPPPPPDQAPGPPQAPPDPSKMAAVQLKGQQAQQEAQQKQAELQQQGQIKQAELAAQERARQTQAQLDAASVQSEAQIRAHQTAMESMDRAADRQSHEKIAQMRLEAEALKVHADAQKAAQETHMNGVADIAASLPGGHDAAQALKGGIPGPDGANQFAPPGNRPMGEVTGPVPGGPLGAPKKNQGVI